MGRIAFKIFAISIALAVFGSCKKTPVNKEIMKMVGVYAGLTHDKSEIYYLYHTVYKDTTYLDTFFVFLTSMDSIGIGSYVSNYYRFKYDSTGKYHYIFGERNFRYVFDARFIPGTDSLLCGDVWLMLDGSSRSEFNGKKI